MGNMAWCGGKTIFTEKYCAKVFCENCKYIGFMDIIQGNLVKFERCPKCQCYSLKTADSY